LTVPDEGRLPNKLRSCFAQPGLRESGMVDSVLSWPGPYGQQPAQKLLIAEKKLAAGIHPVSEMTQWLSEPRKRTLKLRMQANLAGSLVFRSMRQMSSKRRDMLADFVRRKYLVRIECQCRRVPLMRSAGLAKSSSPSAHEIRPMIRPSSGQSILICQPSTKMPSSFKGISAPQSILIGEIRPIQMRLGSCHLRRCWLSRCSA
jgi:hypothetical protein